MAKKLGLSWIASRFEERIILTKNSGISQEHQFVSLRDKY
jgi:hypothetical protein